MDKVGNLQPNTIGKRRCEVILNQILIEEDNPYLTRKVMSRYNRFRDGCKPIFNRLSRAEHQRWKRVFLDLWYKETIQDLVGVKHFYPERVFSFLRNCITAHYRTLIRGSEK